MLNKPDALPALSGGMPAVASADTGTRINGCPSARIVDERDQRSWRVGLTPLGRRKFKEAQKHWRVAQQKFEKVLGAQAARALRDVHDIIASDAFNDALK